MLTRTGSRADGQGALRDRAQRIVLQLTASQIAVALVLAAILSVTAGSSAAYSVMVGALIAIMPNYYLGGRMLKRAREATAEASLRGIYAGEFVKIAFTAALFVIAIRLLDIDFLMVVAGYLTMVAVNGVAFRLVDLGELPAKTAP